MSSMVAIITDKIKKSITAAQPTRSQDRVQPDFKLKRFSSLTGGFGKVGLCASGGGGGTVFGASEAKG